MTLTYANGLTVRLRQTVTGVFSLSLLSARYPEYGAPDLALLDPDMRSVAAFRLHLEKMLRARHGVAVLAIYVSPAQVIVCPDHAQQGLLQH